MKVPFLDLNAHHQPLRAEFSRAIEEVIDCGAFAGGPYVEKFEQEFAAFCQVPHAIGVGNGTDALWLILLALGIGPGDEVITVPNTFFATVEAILLTGAKAVMVDVVDGTYNMDPSKLAAAANSRTKAIIPVHLFGQTADMDPILEFAKRHSIHVVEDACQAHGAEYKGRRAGSMGVAAAFSMYPGKNLGALGEAGAVTTTNAELAATIRMLRDHGQSKKYFHKLVGFNGRLDGIQAAVLSIKLKHLEANNDRRIAHAKHYHQRLTGVDGIILPAVPTETRHVYHIFPVRVQRRDEVMKFLTERGVGCGIHYPIPVHLQEACQNLGYPKGSFPFAERCATEFVSLPMYPELTTAQLDLAADTLREAVRLGKGAEMAI